MAVAVVLAQVDRGVALVALAAQVVVALDDQEQVLLVSMALLTLVAAAVVEVSLEPITKVELAVPASLL